MKIYWQSWKSKLNLVVWSNVFSGDLIRYVACIWNLMPNKDTNVFLVVFRNTFPDHEILTVMEQAWSFGYFLCNYCIFLLFDIFYNFFCFSFLQIYKPNFIPLSSVCWLSYRVFKNIFQFLGWFTHEYWCTQLFFFVSDI